MGLLVVQVSKNSLPTQLVDAQGSNLTECKNYEIGTLPGRSTVYVLARIHNTIKAKTIIKVDPETGRCAFISEEEANSGNEQQGQLRQVSYSGACLSVEVLLMEAGSIAVQIIQSAESDPIYYKVGKQ